MVSNTEHSVTYTYSSTDENISTSQVTEMIADVQINQNETKMKIPPYSDGDGSGSSSKKTKTGEMIYIKQ